MATKVTAPPPPRVPPKKPLPDDWFDGGWWDLIRGEDFDQSPDYFKEKLRRAAQDRGGTMEVKKRTDENDRVHLFAKFTLIEVPF
jgi:hypothetical protein